MPTRKRATPREKISPAILAAMRPVDKRLARIEELLIEMRGALDAQIKKTARLQLQLESVVLDGKRR
jgi:hypothetical protein